MKSLKSLILIFLLFPSLSIAQTFAVGIVVGKTEKEVTEYFNQLIKLSNNRQLRIEKDVSPSGDLVLTIGFPINEEKIFSCTTILAMFSRSSAGLEVCVRQGLIGSSEYAQPNLSFIKDTFKFVSENTWEKPLEKIPAFKIQAKFTKVDSDGYTIVYDLIE